MLDSCWAHPLLPALLYKIRFPSARYNATIRDSIKYKGIFRLFRSTLISQLVQRQRVLDLGHLQVLSRFTSHQRATSCWKAIHRLPVRSRPKTAGSRSFRICLGGADLERRVAWHVGGCRVLTISMGRPGAATNANFADSCKLQNWLVSVAAVCMIICMYEYSSMSAIAWVKRSHARRHGKRCHSQMIHCDDVLNMLLHCRHSMEWMRLRLEQVQPKACSSYGRR